MFIIKMTDLKVNFNDIYNLAIVYGIRFLFALIILYIGLKLIKLMVNRIEKRLNKLKVETSLKSFLLPLISIILKITLLVSIIGMFGVEITSFIALLGSLGFAIGLALQGSLANFAGGVLILILKPFKVGDYIEADEYSGTVKDIHIFYTVLATSDNRKIVIPNANLSNSSLINYSSYPIRRLELKIFCGYNNDLIKVKQTLENFISAHPKILKEPNPSVSFVEYGESSIKFAVYGWVNADDYGSTYNELMFSIKDVFARENINIPYPQLDVYIKNTDK